jgi:C1A family cysteine protease
MTQQRKYGWKPDLPDQRDHAFKVRRAARLPAKADLRAYCPAVYDQGQLGSCTAHAAAAAYAIDLARQGMAAVAPSRLKLYYDERVRDGTVRQDAGSYLRTAAKVLGKDGVCEESLWPYVEAKFASKPPAPAYAASKAHTATSYQRLDTGTPASLLTALRQCLAGGSPAIFGFSVYESFESDKVARTGVVPLPSAKEALLGGHAVAAVGYDDAKKRFLVRNSWGPDWGVGGYCWMPYAYLTDPNLAEDFWQITTVSG